MYQGRDKVPRAVVERDVVWMAGDAGFVEGNQDVDRGGGLLVALSLHGVGEARREGGGEQLCDLGLVPRTRHRVGEVTVAGLDAGIEG